jgi:para-aminobenzoate synthetase component I
LSHYVISQKHPARAVAELELAADELIGALLSLDPARRLHLLDSGGARGGEARFLVAGFDPEEYVEAFGRELRVWSQGESGARVRGGSALALLDERLAERRTAGAAVTTGLPAEELPPFGFDGRGACFLTLSYESAHRFEPRLARLPASEEGEPDAVLAFFDLLVVHDYARGRTFLHGADAEPARSREAAETLLASAEARRRGVEFEPSRTKPGPSRASVGLGRGAAGEALRLPEGVAANFTRGEYEAAVERLREHIRAGDIYQANLTQRITCPPREDAAPEQVFRRLRSQHPAAFGAFLRQRTRTIVSASPERFIRVGAAGDEDGGGRVIEAWPIKGTRRRGRDPEEDARLRAELLASEKDRAENVMIVDLMRNDLGRVCRYGSIGVAELCALQEHPTLFHLVSKVQGRLRGGVTAGELLRAAFPCGSVTGAPKLRAMEILGELERVPRGVSMGSIGYFSFGGAADLNVAIRTITFNREGAARFHVGGGVVADSSPAAEYDETLVKARALLRALGAGDAAG